MIKKLNKMRIKQHLNYAFRGIIIAFSVVSLLVACILLYMTMDYNKVINNYAFPQGDIAIAMDEAAEVRSASRGIVGYDSNDLITSMKKQHDEHVEAFEAKLEEIRPTMICRF